MQGESLREAWERGRSAWPDVQLGEADFARLLAGRSPSADLYLACACVEGDPRALAALEAMLLPAVAPVLARLDADERDEIVQELRERLLVPRGGKPARIAGYSGRGPLENWLKVAGLREAIEVDRRRKRAPVSDEAALAGAPAMGADPDTEYLRRHFRPRFEAALKTAMAALTPRERNLLRMHHVDGVGVERLGSIYRVHASTASRWMTQARAQVLEETQKILRDQLQLSASGWRSLLRTVRSQLHLSIETALGAEKEQPGMQKSAARPSSR